MPPQTDTILLTEVRADNARLMSLFEAQERAIAAMQEDITRLTRDLAFTQKELARLRVSKPLGLLRCFK